MAEHVRIDEGVKRGPRRKIDIRAKASRAGTYNAPHPPGLRETVTQAAYDLLACGMTTCQIGDLHGVPGSTVRFWLLNDEKAELARRSMIAQELARTGEEIRTANDALSLSRGREEARYWMWIAERRESRLYGQQIAVKNEVVITDEDAGLLTSARELLTIYRDKLAERVVEPEKPDLQIGNAPLSDSDH